MPVFPSFLPLIWPWFILFAALIAALRQRMGLALVLLGLFGGVVVALGYLTSLALGVIALGLAGASRLGRLSGRAGIAGHAALMLWCLVLGAHLLPGVRNLMVLDEVMSGPASATFTLYYNIDKPMVFFAVVLACPVILHQGSPFRPRALMLGLALLPALFLLTLLTGALRFEPGLPGWWLIFALSNLLLTCLGEEAFFRGYLQTGLIRWLGPVAGVAAASGLFGLAHIGGGVALAGFAALLGPACGLGYWATGRLWVPVAMHFGFNFAHLALFTYPAPV